MDAPRELAPERSSASIRGDSGCALDWPAAREFPPSGIPENGGLARETWFSPRRTLQGRAPATVAGKPLPRAQTASSLD